MLILGPAFLVAVLTPWVDLVRILTGSLRPADGWAGS